MNKLYNASDNSDTLVDLKRVVAVQRQYRPSIDADEFVPAITGCYWTGIYLIGRAQPIELFYPESRKAAWEQDIVSLSARRGPLV